MADLLWETMLFIGLMLFYVPSGCWFNARSTKYWFYLKRVISVIKLLYGMCFCLFLQLILSNKQRNVNITPFVINKHSLISDKIAKKYTNNDTRHQSMTNSVKWLITREPKFISLFKKIWISSNVTQWNILRLVMPMTSKSEKLKCLLLFTWFVVCLLCRLWFRSFGIFVTSFFGRIDCCDFIF